MEKNMKNDIMENEMNSAEFRDRMIQLRKQKGWSQEELGERLNVSRQTVSKWELGESKPKMPKIVAMSKLYNLTTDELIYGRDENKPVDIEAKVITNDNTQILPKVESIENNAMTTIQVSTNVESNKSFIKKHLRKIIIVLVILLLIIYLGFSVYKFCILKEINDKFNEYKNVDNCYLERKEVVTNNNTGTAYILNTRYWCRDGLLKIEEIRTENGTTETFYRYVNLNENHMYIVNENTKKVIKSYDMEEYKKMKDGIIDYTIRENYYKNNIDILKASFNILEKINIEKNNYIKNSKNQNGNVKRIYNKENALIEQSYTSDENEEIKVLYSIEINTVKNEDVNIEFLELINCEIME